MPFLKWFPNVAAFFAERHPPQPPQPPVPQPNIVDIAAGSDDFNLLVRALDTAGLTATVRAATDVTVFAPTDAAFTQLAVDLGYTGPAGDEDAVFTFLVDALTILGGGDPIKPLTDILLYHVSPGAKTAAEIDVDGTIPTLLPGASFGAAGVELVDAEPDIANPYIVTPDLQGANGTIQVIDRVLLPLDLAGNGPTDNIVDIATGSDDFNLLVMALSTAGLVETVQAATDITVFAPTDAAFTQLATDLGFAGDTADEDAVFGFLVGALTELGGGDPLPILTNILLYHVSPGAKSAAAIDALEAVPTLLTGATFGSEGTELVDNEPDVDNPNIVIRDLGATNGTVQVIDRVLIPIDIEANDPDQKIVGTFRKDALEGRGGDDLIVGLAGRDDLDGNGGDDRLFGNRGRDDLDGGAGNDKLFGGWGRDILDGGEGDDHLVGGWGRDTFDFTHAAGDDTVADFRRDVLKVSSEDFANAHVAFEALEQVGHDTVLMIGDASVTFLNTDIHDFEGRIAIA